MISAYMSWVVLVSVLIPLAVSACIRNSVSEDEREQAIEAAYQIYEQEKAAGTDFSDGPCIAEELTDVPGWSVDVAHDPRQDVDNEPENQCQFYRDGKTTHFVELDPDGNLIRAQ